MPYTQQKKLNKSFFVTLIFLALIFSTMFWPVNGIVKIAGAVVFFAVYLYLRRGYMYFSSGASMIKKSGPSERVWKTLQKAVDAGISPEYKNIVALTMIQNGKVDDGVVILNGIIEKNSEPHQTNVARVNMAMAYYARRDFAEAASVLENLASDGYEDSRTFEMLARCYLSGGLLQKAKKVLVEARHREVDTDIMKDNTGMYYIQTGEWKRARQVLSDLVEGNPVFPDAYVHAALADYYFGDVEKALENLDFALGKRTHTTDIYTMEYISRLREVFSPVSSARERPTAEDVGRERVPLSQGGECSILKGEE